MAPAPLAPSPPNVDVAAVVAHGCRHLAFLMKADPIAQQAAKDQPELWSLLAAMPPGPAGALRGATPQVTGEV